jgi:NAD+ synthetase
VLGVRDYIGKNGFPGAILGLSGGIDSAWCWPSRSMRWASRQGARGDDAVALHRRHLLDRRARHGRALGVRYDEISIVPVRVVQGRAGREFKGLPEDTAEENIQARIRGTLLMALSNKFGAIVLTTGNKSEMATGYCTLYGDMAGGFAVIKDVLKTSVFAAGALAQRPRPVWHRRRARFPSASSRAPQRRAAARPDRPGQPAALRGPGRNPGTLHGGRRGHRRDHCRGL